MRPSKRVQRLPGLKVLDPHSAFMNFQMVMKKYASRVDMSSFTTFFKEQLILPLAIRQKILLPATLSRFRKAPLKNSKLIRKTRFVLLLFDLMHSLKALLIIKMLRTEKYQGIITSSSIYGNPEIPHDQVTGAVVDANYNKVKI